jgi:hypothetical protein
MPLIMFVSSSFNTYVNLPKKKNVCDRLEKVGKHGKWLEHVPKTWPYRLQWLNEYGEVKVNK